ncbi:MAG TPA: CheR family methyltransferase [Geobacterales bacterium]|nr:CheR family methyltransferase [Geobacterales bacterium]
MMAGAAPRDFAFTHRDFERIRKMIYGHAGISLNDSKADMVYSRLTRRVRSKGMVSFADYLDHLEQEGDETEWELFVNALTTNLTSFFRESHHFPIMCKHLKQVAAKRPLRLWSCASSTGEEPYSMAMAAVEQFNTFLPPVEILATDLDTNVLEAAQRGVYPYERVARLDSEQLRRFFLRGEGNNAGMVRVKSELQRLITFRQLNLLTATWPITGRFDVIFCRNVMIYFDKPTQRKILERFARVIAPDGLLFAGHSESFLHAADIFQSCGRTVYRPIQAEAGG